MKTITIQPNDKDVLVVSCYETEENIADFERNPHRLGFYHYGGKIKDKTALNRLKKVMIEDREQKIASIKEEIKEIKELEL